MLFLLYMLYLSSSSLLLLFPVNRLGSTAAPASEGSLNGFTPWPQSGSRQRLTGTIKVYCTNCKVIFQYNQ